MAVLQYATFVVLTTAAALLLVLPQTSADDDSPCPPQNPFCPVWVPCNFTEHKGPYCSDCNTRVICTPVGGLVRPCWLPGRSNCVDGHCRSEPSEECSAATEVPAPATDAPTSTTEGLPATTAAEDLASTPIE